MALELKPAVKEQSKLRLALYGPPGGGKTRTALELAASIAGDIGKVGLIDTEHRSAQKYAPRVGQFQTVEMETYGPDQYLEALKLIVDAGLLVAIIDSFSHAWDGEGGILDMQTRFERDNPGQGWNLVKPHEKRLWNGVLSENIHLIVTMRSRNEWKFSEEEDSRGRKKQKREIIGTEPIQRKGTEYEFDVVAHMQPSDEVDENVVLSIEKSRYDEELPRGLRIIDPGEEFQALMNKAITAGEPPKAATQSEIKLLKKLLSEEGREDKRVNDVLDAERAKNGGVLPQKFVREQTEKAMKRLESQPPGAKPEPEPEVTQEELPAEPGETTGEETKDAEPAEAA